MAKIRSFLEGRFWAVLFLAMSFALLFPQLGTNALYIIQPTLMLVLFLVLLKIDILGILRSVQKWWLTLYLSVASLIVVPLGFYYVFEPFDTTYALAITLIVAMPAAMASATLSDLLHGNTAMAAGLTIITSIVTPFTFPLIISFAAQESVEVSVSKMFVSLAITIFVPMALAQGVKKYASPLVARLDQNISSINVLLMFAIVYVAVAAQQRTILDGINRYIWQLAVMFIVFIILHIIGFLLVPKAKFPDKLTSAITLAYMNNGISIVIASEFFSDEVLVLVVLSEIPWVMCLGPFKAAINSYKTTRLTSAKNYS